jgi:hypothetical protein
MTNPKKEIPVTVSSGNVFADFGIPNADELQTEVQIAFALNASRCTPVVAKEENQPPPKPPSAREWLIDERNNNSTEAFAKIIDHWFEDLLDVIEDYSETVAAPLKTKIVELECELEKCRKVKK